MTRGGAAAACWPGICAPSAARVWSGIDRHVARDARLPAAERLVLGVLVPRRLQRRVEALLDDAVVVVVDPHLVAVRAQLVRVGHEVLAAAVGRVDAVGDGRVELADVLLRRQEARLVAAALVVRGEPAAALLRVPVELVAGRAADAVGVLGRRGYGQRRAGHGRGDVGRVAVDAELVGVGVRGPRERLGDVLVGLGDHDGARQAVRVHRLGPLLVNRGVASAAGGGAVLLGRRGRRAGPRVRRPGDRTNESGVRDCLPGARGAARRHAHAARRARRRRSAGGRRRGGPVAVAFAVIRVPVAAARVAVAARGGQGAERHRKQRQEKPGCASDHESR